jgi:hypothetical protein
MFTMDEEKLIILIQERECLCSLQHKDYDNNFVIGKCLKEIGAEVHDKKLLFSLIK